MSPLKQYILEQVEDANPQEVAAIVQEFKPKLYKKGDYFNRSTDQLEYLGFVDLCPMRNIFFKEDGTEVTARIREINAFIGQLPNFDKPHDVEFLQDQEVLVVPVRRFQELLKNNLTANILMRKHVTDQLVAVTEKHFMFLTAPAKKRYEMIIENNPDLLQKFPLRFIASMIGITPTQLSRVRKSVN